MITTPAIAVALNGINLASPVLMSTQRWEAIRQQFSGNFMTERWFVIAMVGAIIVLAVLLVAVSLHRKQKEQKTTHKLFVEYANKRGLTEFERQTLLDIASKAGIKQSDTIFTMSSAFDYGAARMIEEALAGSQAAEENKRLKTELSFLREKLGFQKPHSSSIGSPTRPNKLSSRQIPVGKKLYITRRKSRTSDNLESTVIKNDDMELTVELTVPLESTPGELWCGRYYFGASVWEFDTSAVSSNGNVLVLNHSDNIRFVNRRRFVRVPVDKPASIARFPFARALTRDIHSSKAASETEVPPDNTEHTWAPPKFIPATLTELAGSGLRLESVLEVKTNDRVLVMFRLDEEKDETSMPIRNRKPTASKVIEDIGIVRHIKAIENGLSIAVELTGLSDSDLGELIQVTNRALIKAKAEGRNITTTKEQVFPEPVAVQENAVLQ